MKEKRCTAPHPRIPAAPCNAIVRAWATDGEVEVECPRCHSPVRLDFRKELTAGAITA